MASSGTLLRANDNDIILRGLRRSYAGTYITDALIAATYGDDSNKGTITGATNASPIVITSAAHGLTTGDTVMVIDVNGNLAANTVTTVTVVDANSFSLDGTTGDGAYTDGGTWYYVRSGMSEISLDYESGSQGDYRGVLAGTVDMGAAGSKYREVIRASNYTIERTRNITIQEP